jgi:PAS domain S-box-containing protein
LRKMFESVTDGISVVDLNGIIAEVNQRTVEMHGFKSRDELLGRSAFELVAPRDHEMIAANMRKAIKQGTVRGVEYTLLKADGSEFPGELSTSILRDVSGNRVGHITIARDITERKRAEEVLRESEERYRNLFESTHDMIQSVAPDGHFIFANRAWLETMGYTEAELPSLNLFKIIHPDSLPHCQKMFARVMAGESVSNVQATFVAKDGRSVLVEGNAAARCIGDKVVATQGFFHDITERKRMEDELKAAQEQLIRSEKLAAIGQLASGVGHELRNPLGAIKNAVLYVRRKIAKGELSASEAKVLQFLGIIDEEVDSANKVIADLLSFSRVAKPTVSLVNAGSIIRGALDHVAIPRNVKVVADVDPDLLMVMVDAAQIKQVFINVILNALEAMPKGGRLEIRAGSKDELVTVEFTDTGCGIPERVMGAIFDPLFTTKPKGIGLGLAMSKSIMERHGGDIGVKSKEGKGTTFTIFLPTRVV